MTSSAARADRIAPVAPLALLALWLVATLGLRPLLIPDEGRYAGVAREMLGGDRLTPLLDGMPFFHKPPLMYWLDMAAMAAFGVNGFTARVAPAVGAWAMGAALYLALARWRGEAAARLALVVLATSPFYFVGGQYANHDMLVAGWITVAVLLFARAVEAPDPALDPAVPDDRRPVAVGWLVAAWIAAGLAVLSKGLIGIVLPVLILGPWLLAQRRWRQMLKLLHPAGVAAGLAVAAPWFVAMETRHPGFLDYFFVEQHFRRYAAATFNNAQPFWFYFVLLPLLPLLWSAWLPAAVMRLWRRAGCDRRDGLFAWWIAVVVVFFSLPNSKLVGYLLPVLAPLAALLAAAMRPGGRVAVVAALSAAVCVATVVGLAVAAPKSAAPAARAIMARFEPGDRVVFVDEMFYDLPVVANLKDPVIVASAWDDGTVPLYDNWRKELYESARFDPARGAQLLWPIRRLAELGCGPHATWFVSHADERGWIAGIPGLEPVHADRRTQVLRTPPGPCPAAK